MNAAGTIRLACLGAGRMGRGIAHAAAYAGHPVALLDAKQRDAQGFEALKAEALSEIESGLAMLADLGAFDAAAIPAIMARITVHPLAEADAAMGNADIVFEGVPETRDAKAEAFALFDKVAAPGAILASTTSTMLSTELAALTARPAQFLNAHWLNPAFLVPLVELSPTDSTDPAVLDRLKGFLEGMGKVPVTCRAAPGYIVPRIQMLAMNEAARIVEEGVASAEDVDKAVIYGFGLRFAVLGLLEFIDWGGGDILAYASRYMTQATGDARYGAPDIVERNMAEGRIGLRTGQGFYDYRNRDADAFRREKLGAFVHMLQRQGLMQPPQG
ncbi:MAG: 3-hydroxybutyryl-CoA dehydrogenase [Pararhodobacter sp.]